MKREKKERAKIIADSVVDNIEQYFAPLKPGNQRQIKLKQSVGIEDMAKILNKMATKGYLTGVKVSKEAMENFLLNEEKELSPLINFAESELTERIQARKERRKQQREKKNPKKKPKGLDNNDSPVVVGMEDQGESDTATEDGEDTRSNNHEKEEKDENEPNSDTESSDDEVPIQQLSIASKGTSSKAVRVDSEHCEEEEEQNRKKKRKTLVQPKEGLRRSRRRTTAD